MGNKYVVFLLFVAVLIAGGIVYQNYFRSKDVGPAAWNGTTVRVHMRSLKDQWKFEPDILNVKRGDKVIVEIYNEDSYDHGFAIESFGVNNRLFPTSTTTLEFIAANVGDFPFYCSVACGEGHARQTGKVIVTK